MENHVGPHDYVRYGVSDWWRSSARARCRVCYWPAVYHPTQAWRVARPIGDGSVTSLSDALSTEYVGKEAPDA